MADAFNGHTPGLNSPGSYGAAVSPHDDNDLAVATRALYVGGAGNVAVITVGGDTVTFVGVTAGTILPMRVTRVLSTGTTATNMVAIR